MAISVRALTEITKSKKKLGGNMKKLQKQIYRVECNFGSKYFKTLDKARKYFEYKVSLDFDAELWLVKYKYNSRNEICSASQVLLGYSAIVLSKF